MIAGSTAFGVKLVFINVTIVTVPVATGWQTYCSGYLVSSKVKRKENRQCCKTAVILRLLEGSVGEVFFAFTVTSVLLYAMPRAQSCELCLYSCRHRRALSSPNKPQWGYSACKNSNSFFSIETCNSFVYRYVTDAGLNSISLPFRGNYLPLNNLPIWGW